MKKDEISRLLDRYNSARKAHKDAYFDTDEIERILISFEEADDYSMYEEILALGMKLHPGDPDLMLRKCKLYITNEEYDMALTLLQEIEDTDNEELELLHMECYVMMDQYEKAVEITEKLIAEDCDYIETVFEYITPLLNDMEMYKEARNYIDRGLSFFPDNIILLEELCFILEAENKLDEVISIYDKLIDRNPYSHEYWFSLGRIAALQGKYDRAIEAFDFAHTCDESNKEMILMKGYCLFLNENYEKAIEVYTELASDPEIAIVVKSLISECYIKMEEYEKGYWLLHQLFEENEKIDDSKIYINYIICCIFTGRIDQTFDMIQEASTLFPENDYIILMALQLHLKNEDDELIDKTIERMIKILETKQELSNFYLECVLRVGTIYFDNEQSEKALYYYKKVHAVRPDFPFLNIYLSLAYYDVGDKKKGDKFHALATPEEVFDFFEKKILDNKNDEDILDIFSHQPIPPHELSNEYLKNKGNRN